jgi:1-deoxy-D-xylulose-5-phosphate reductoisomerase
VDHETFPALQLARAAGIAGGLVPAAYNAANEQAVAAFTSGSLGFLGITEVLERIVDEADQLRSEPSAVQDVLDAEAWARARADEVIHSMAGVG